MIALLDGGTENYKFCDWLTKRAVTIDELGVFEQTKKVPLNMEWNGTLVDFSDPLAHLIFFVFFLRGIKDRTLDMCLSVNHVPLY